MKTEERAGAGSESMSNPEHMEHTEGLKHMDPKTGAFLTSEKEFYSFRVAISDGLAPDFTKAVQS